MRKLSTKNLLRLLRARLIAGEVRRHEVAEQRMEARVTKAEGELRNALRCLGSVHLRPCRDHDRMVLRSEMQLDPMILCQIQFAGNDDFAWDFMAEDIAHGLARQLRIIGLSGLVRAAQESGRHNYRLGAELPAAWPY